MTLEIGNLQIDNLINDDMPVIFCSKKIFEDLVLNDKNYSQLSDF